jgi:carbon storage regulator
MDLVPFFMEDFPMLVLSRKPGEKLYIGNNITVTVVEVKGSRVRLGIEAPGDVQILRAELNGFADTEPTIVDHSDLATAKPR